MSETPQGIKSYSVGSQVKGKLYDMSVDDLRDYIRETSSPIAKELAEEVLRDKVNKASGGIIAFKEPNEENNQGVVKSNLPTFAQDTLTLPKGNLPVQREENESERTMREYRERIAAEEAKGPKPFERFKNYLSGEQKASTARALGYSTPQVSVPAQTADTAPVVAPVVAPAAPAANNVIPGTTTTTNVPQGSQTAPPAGIKTIAPPSGTAPAPAAAPASTNKTAAAAPDTKLEFPTTGNPALDKYFKNVLEKASKPPETVEEEIAKKEKYLGPDDSVQKERARLMAAKSNIQDEKFREFNMNAALFFAKMATTPGNVAFAALTALKNTIPTFVASDKEKGKLFREIDKGLVDLDKAARLEKSGNYDAAEKLVAETAKNQHEKVGKVISYFQAVNVANIGKEGKIAAAKITGDNSSDFKVKQLQARVRQNIDTARANKDYQELLNLAKRPVNDKTPENIKTQVENAKKTLQARETEFAQRLKDVGIVDDTSSTTAPGGGLTQNKDGTFTYTPKT